MDEGHGDPLKPKRLKEDDDRSTSDVSQDGTTNIPNDPNMEKQKDSVTNGDQEMKNDVVEYNSQVLSASGQRKTTHNYNNNEKSGKPGSSTDNHKVKGPRDSSEIHGNLEQNFGSAQGKNNQMEGYQIQKHCVQPGSAQVKKRYAIAAKPTTKTQVCCPQAARMTGSPKRSYSDVTRKTTENKALIHEVQSTKIDFYLLILGDYSVEKAYIHLGSDRGNVPLELADRDSNLWKCSEELPGDPIKDHFKYKYVFHSTGNKPSRYEEVIEKQVESHTQLDVFHFPDDEDHVSEVVPKSIIFYLKWWLQFVEPTKICEILTRIESFYFVNLGEKHVQECINWIVEHALSCTASDIQRLYLCIVLSDLHQVLSPEILPQKKPLVKACDRLLQSLNVCVDSNFLSTSNLKRLSKIAVFLVRESSSPGWFTLAAHFYPYLGIEYVLDDNNSRGLNCIYDVKEYREIVNTLLSQMEKKIDDNQAAHKDVLYMVLEHAPNLDAAWELFNVDLSWLFQDECEKVDFFVKFYQAAVQGNSTQNKCAGAKLIEFHKLPEKMKLCSKMRTFLLTTVREYVRSNDELKDDHVEKFLQTITSRKYLYMEQVLEILMELSKSRSLPRQLLLLDILDNERFEKYWHDTAFMRKVDICKVWVITTLVNKTREKKLNVVQRVETVYEAINEIMACSLNTANKNLAREISAKVVERILKNADAISVLQTRASIEKCAVVVQDCYISHVEKLLKQNPKVVKKPSTTLNTIVKECLKTSLGKELLFYIVDIIAPETMTRSAIDEVDFENLLEWCDIWILLLTTEDMVECSRKCVAAKRVCERLKTCIENGDISVHFLEVVDKKKEEVSLLCASVLNKSVRKGDDRPDCRNQILNEISKLVHIREECSTKFQFLGEAITCAKTVSNDVCLVNGTETVFKKFNYLEQNWRRKKVCELQDDAFWGTMQLFLDPAKEIQSLTKSLSFMTVAKKALKESNSKLVENESETTENNDFCTLMVFLATKAKEDFQGYWNSVFEDSGSLDVETMKTLLDMLKNEKQVDEEVALLEEYFERTFPPGVKENIENYVKCPNVMERVEHIIRILEIFGVADSANEVMKEFSQYQTLLKSTGDLTLAFSHDSMKEAKQIVSSFSGDLHCVIEQLARSSELLGFIKETVEEDIRFLIDAVEEHSDQFLSESSVSDLIDVHGFLAPLITKRKDETCSPQDFLETLKISCHNHKDIATKIEQCNTNVNSLRGLYKNIANRGQMTKEIINNCLSKGEYWVSLKDGKCKTTMTYVLQGSSECKHYEYSLSELHDLRSRAHLITASHKNSNKVTSEQFNKSSGDIDFDIFITQVNLLTEISMLLSKLLSSGYVGYRKFWKKMKTTDDLKINKDSLQQDLINWENILEKAREKFYFLNFYRSDQICTLYDFLMSKSDINCDEVLPLIHFVDPTVTEQQLQQYRESQDLKTSDSGNNPDLLVSTVGQALLNIFSNWQGVIRWMSNDGEGQSHPILEATVAPGTIFVASLKPESLLTANVILQLYENTSNAFPEPYQIVFCNSQTTWEELHLLLQRCFAPSQNLRHESLFCIANVELLPNELQFKLVDAIKEKQTSYQSSRVIQENTDYQLALICCGGDHHHMVEQFSQYSHHIAGMTDLVLADRLKSSWPEVKMITSTLPGLGKTEQIKNEAVEKSMNVVTFSISGPFKPSKLIQRLKDLKVTKYHCLHLDIGEVSDPLPLDTFLFQLIVTGMVSAGNQFYHLPTKHIYIEVANTLKDWLREWLVVLKLFTRVHLEWKAYEDFVASSKITSNTQVVCQYLDILDRDCLESKEVFFSGPEKSKPLPAHRCQQLLAKYFPSDDYTNFTTLRIFLRVLADQLLKFSKSTFFKIENLDTMVGEESQDVRKNLFQALLQVSKDFACRAITACPSSGTQNLSQQESARALDEAMAAPARSAEDMVERVKGMIRWEDNNHLLVVFHGWNTQAITAVYRNKNLVPPNVAKLLKSQAVRENEQLEDFSNFTQGQLKEKLEKIACMKQPEKEKTVLETCMKPPRTQKKRACHKLRRRREQRTKRACMEMPEEENLFPQYALTTDNILKMILIILRVRVKIPVIIMGETGCGKTSLVRYLANTCGAQFYIFNVHAGISEEKIIEFIEEKENLTRSTKKQTWIFLDEINTCDYLGLISDLMCHHSLLGRPLSKYLVFLAACNPYKERPVEHIKTAGLEGKNITDEHSKLVYRVHPLPEAMIDYVWDYGSLAPKDERDYIKRMVKSLPDEYEDMLVDLLAASQEFIRNAENNRFCVSLRDVHRCILLISWFKEMTKKRQQLSSSNNERSKRLEKFYLMSEEYNNRPMIKSIVLSLAHCYMSRLPTADLRKDYRKCMITVFSHNKTMMSCNESLDSFEAIVRVEEEDYLDRMELPEGTAKNAALRENVFVMLVCILNRIPVFVVGKPGCSKSLSIQLIRSNLRGRDSKDPLFRELPQLYVVSYQGSESSTSEGIEKVFAKARRYTSQNKDGNVLPVVLLDEVGLAENSKYNPLKVLHSLLEPGDGKLPDVAVVGISNWSLDAAKMNRAIHLSRPEPTEEDLYDTGYSLHYANGKNDKELLQEEELQCLAEAYCEYQAQQTHANFHGLRDYYSLIKSLNGSSNSQQINISLQRNFGGLPGEVTKIQKIFFDKLEKHMTCDTQDNILVTQLIQENLEDPHARHLMLKTSGDSAMDILEKTLEHLGKETITIYGSRFEEDVSEEYNYRILSRIILCMERDCILILRDLESIYGSLYDMLNQNYAVVGNRRNCRVALGAYSNPMCQVNKGFRCIVLIDEHRVDYSDPPFLNRFEKQVLRFSDVLTDDKQNIITELQRWIHDMSTVEGLESHFKETDMFIGFNKDTLPSLVYSQGHDEGSPEELFRKCKDELMWTASPDGVLRTQRCNLSKENFEEVQNFCDEYLKQPLHHGFASFMEHVKTNHQETSFFAGDEIGSKTIVMTFSNIHTDIHQCLGSGFNCQVERLSAYKSEKQLAERIDEFWNAPEKDLFVLQSKPDLDGSHLLHARSIIEEKRNSYKQRLSEIKAQDYKHVCIVVHVQRGQTVEDVPWQFNFLCGWRQVFLDVLEAPVVPLNEIIGKSLQQLLTSSVWPIHRIAQNDLLFLWCITRIKYTESHQRILRISKNLFGSKQISQIIERLILQSIDLNASEEDQETYAHENWHVQVACDRQALVNSSTLHYAMEKFVSRLVRNPLAKIVYFLEKENAWPPHLSVDYNETLLPNLEALWCEFIISDSIFKMSDIPEPRGPESYILDSNNLDLRLPFSQIVMRKVDSIREAFLEDDATLAQDEDNLDDDYQLNQNVRQQQFERFSKMIIDLVPERLCVTSDFYDLYMNDVFDMTTSDFSPMLSRSHRVSIVQAMFFWEVKKNLPAKDMPEFFTILHIFVWLHREEILDLLGMVNCCQPFVPLEVLLNITSEMSESLSEVQFVKRHERSEVFDNESPRIEEAASNETDSSHEIASNPEQDIDDLEQSNAMLGESEWEKPLRDFQESEEVAQKETGCKGAINEETETEHDDLERFGDILVTAYCEEMLPSRETVEKNGGLEPWIRNANFVLSLSFKISEQSPAFHYLRLCVDFAKIIITSAALPTSLSSLYIFNEIGTALRPQYLDHEESFDKITNQITKPLEEDMKDHMDKQEALQKFSALFYGRCIDTNVDNSAVRPIVEQVLSLERPELVILMDPVVLHLLVADTTQSPDIFTDLIKDPSAIENCPCLQNIDGVFKDRFLNGVIHHDSYPSVMICDLIQSVLNSDHHFEIDDIDNPECQILMVAKSANVLLSQNSEDGCGLRVLSSIAFLRQFFERLAKFVAENPTVLKQDSPYIHVMTEINALLKDSKLSQVFFLKQLHKRASLFDLKKWFRESNIFPPITELWDDEKNQDKAVFTAVLKCPDYEKAKAAYWKLLSNDDSAMEEFFTGCSRSTNDPFALLGLLINMLYLKGAVRKLTETERKTVDWFAEKVASGTLPILFQELLLKVIGRRDFHCPQLQLSTESSVEEVEMALLVLHIACVVATGGQSERLPMYRYFTNPGQYELPCVLAHSKEEMRSVFDYQTPMKNSSCVTCVCGLRLAFKDNVDLKACPHCYEVVNDETKSSKVSELVATLPESPESGASPEWDYCTGSMGPGVHCALHFIVYSSFFAGIALGTSSGQKLPDSLKPLRRTLDVDSDSRNLANFCFKNMKSDLLCLMKILNSNKNTAIKTMHLIVEKSSDLIRGDDLLESNDCSTPKMRREWETMFSQLTERVFLNARETSEQVKEMMKLQQTGDSEGSTLEFHILELDNYEEKPQEQNEQLKRLFRLTKQPCLQDLRSAFLFLPKDVQEKHSFLMLFFAKFDQLKIIGHLHHLLKWSRLISSALTHRISRKDAQSKSINDFINGHLLELKRGPKETESLKKSFEDFKKAWDEMRPIVNEVLKDKGEMPRLKEADRVAYCLTESECGVYLQTAIDILVSHQNSILDATISLSSHQHLALSFLEKQNCSGIASSSIQNVKEKEIISFKWSDDFLQHARNNLEYGKGQEITYNFERIEIELATEIALGKFYLTGTINKFIFANELFHSCGPLLTEFRSLVKQSSSLPDEVQKGLLYLKERRIKEAQDLLQHIEVLLIFLMRKFQNFNVETTLEEFAQKWSSILSSSFPVNLLPEPRSLIKMKHVAALYEGVEDTLADGAIDGLDDKFRVELTRDVKETVAVMVNKGIDRLKPSNFLKALRRFVFRYLSSDTEEHWPEESTELQSCLKEASLWCPGQPPNLHEIPEDITLKYIYSIVKYLEELMEEKKSIANRTDLRSPPRQPLTVKHGRRRVKNFSRS